MKQKREFPVWLGIAATWFGMHCGSGFATGSQYVIYYNSYGWLAMIMPIFTWVLLAVCYYFVFRYCAALQVSSYKDYASNLFFPNRKKIAIVFVVAFDLWCLFAQLLGEAGILAGAGSLFESSGSSYWLGVIIAGAIVLISVIFGATFIMKISTALTTGLVICITILGIWGCAANWSNFTAVVGGHMMPEGATFWEALRKAFTYSGVQISSIFALSALAGTLKPNAEGDVKKAAFGGAALNFLMLWILGLVMIANYPAINSETLPVLAALTGLNVSLLTWLYKIMLFLALVTTGAGCGFAIVTRYTPYFVKWFKISERLASTIIIIVLMAIGVFGSKFGLTAIFSKGYGYLSKMAWPLGIIPALVLVPYRLSQMKKAKAE